MGKEDCLFCSIANKDIPSKIVFEDHEILAFEDVNPQAPLHVLLIPKKHIEKVSDLTQEHAAAVGSLVLAAKEIAKKKQARSEAFLLLNIELARS